MFNSQKINNDPMPWFNASRGRFATRAECPRSTRMPRSKFDNHPNPILVAFREAVRHSCTGAAQGEIARGWLKELGSGALSGGTLADYRPHAVKVLERLSAL